MSLYLKYRPSDFTSLVGQEFTKQTLQKAISDDKTVGAYLFCGPRGTGKTSSARIFAKAVNCSQSPESQYNLDAVEFTFNELNGLNNEFHGVDYITYDDIINDLKKYQNDDFHNFQLNVKLFLHALGRYSSKKDGQSFLDWFFDLFKGNYTDLLNSPEAIESKGNISRGISRIELRNLDVNNKPCNLCNSCIGFNSGNITDIIEIDAASHTGVDNIREIIERAQFAPNFCKYKIYIIDEVHMLSKGAFNALLKILEEPPSHVKFILATTETHKVPETIISRCQRYDFKRISAIDIKNRLLYIAKEEVVNIDEKSLNYIVKNSGGGLRNAISLFEQLINDGDINYDQVVEKLGIVDDEILSNFLTKLLSQDTTIIADFDELIDSGKNIKLFFKELIFYTKNKTLLELKNNSNISSYISLLEILDETYGKTKVSLDENTTFLIGVLKIVSGYSEKLIPEVKKVVNQNSIVTTEVKGVINQPLRSPVADIPLPPMSSEKPKEEISHNDAFDVFGESPKEDILKSAANNSTFESKVFIDILKKSGAKGGLTMALRGSGLELIGNTLIIRIKTKIAAGQVSSADNIALMIQALTNMGIENPEIKSA